MKTAWALERVVLLLPSDLARLQRDFEQESTFLSGNAAWFGECNDVT